LLIIYFVFQIYSQKCASSPICGGCTSQQGCGWCGATQVCSEGNNQGPSDGTKCFGGSWQYGSCKDCQSIKDCRECQKWVGSCSWCQGNGVDNIGTCQPTGFTGCRPAQTCPCDVYSTCSQCIDSTYCSWCGGGDQKCIKRTDSDSCQMPATNCPCNTNKNCDTCRSDTTNTCQWCQSLGACINQIDSDACADPASNITSSCQSYCKGNGHDCHVCNRLPGCTWCKDLTGANANSCVDPLVSQCHFISHTCAICGESAYCSDCVQKSGCVWCSNIQACRQRGADPGCIIPHQNSCDTYCNTATTCDTCGKRIGCGWCTSAQTCVDAATSSCATAHTCPSGGGGGAVCKTCGFDGGSFVGGMFLVIGLIVLLVGGYLFFKWKTTRRVSYTELR